MRIALPDGAIDTTARTASGPRGTASLREKESRLLELLARAAGATVPRERLLVDVLGYQPDSTSRALDATVRRLRRTLVEVGLPDDTVQTVYGEGFRLLSDASATPPAPTRVVGRVTELARLRSWLQDAEARLVSVVGMGGVGKTTLVSAVTAGRPDVVFVDLTAAQAAEDLHRLVQAALSCGHAEDPRDALARRGPVLVVLDNAESLLEPVRSAVPQWLGAGDIRVWVTSRVALGVPLEQIVAIGPMAPADARALFRLRAEGRGAHEPNEPGVDDERALGSLLEALDHHPLSIELAAARVGVLGVDGIRTRLGRAPWLLEGGPGVPERHRSLEAVLDATLALLRPAVVDALGQAQVLPRRFTLRRFVQVVEVRGEPPEVLLQELVDHHLVRRDGRGFRTVSAAGAVRVEGAQREAVEGRWLDAVCVDAAAADREGTAGPSPDELEACVDIALRRGEHERCALLLARLARGWGMRDDPRRLAGWLAGLEGAALSAAGCARRGAVAAFVAMVDDPHRARALADAAVADARRSGDGLALCDALEQRANALSYAHDHDGIEACDRDLRAMADLHRRDGRSWGEVDAALLRAGAAARAGRHTLARPVLASVAALIDAESTSRRLRYLHLRFSAALELGGAEGEARDAVEALGALAERDGSPEERAWAALDRVYHQLAVGALDEAEVDARRALADAGDAWLVAALYTNVVVSLVYRWRWADAGREVATLLRIGTRGGRRAAELAHHMAAWFHRWRGALDEARAHYEEAARLRSGGRLQAFGDAMYLALRGDLVGALEVHRPIAARHVGADWGLQRTRDLDTLVDLLLASERWDEAADAAGRLVRDPCLSEVVRGKAEAAWRAARARPERVHRLEVSYMGLATATWEALALARAGRRDEAHALLGEVEARVEGAGLPPTSEPAWRLRAALRG